MCSIRHSDPPLSPVPSNFNRNNGCYQQKHNYFPNETWQNDNFGGSYQTRFGARSDDQLDEEEPATTLSIMPHSTPATLYWLQHNYEVAEGVCIPRCVIYGHYNDFCLKYCITPVNPASFGKILKQVFPKVSTRRLGNRGKSKYHYFGLGIRNNSTYFETRYSVKASNIRSENRTELSIMSLSRVHRGFAFLDLPNMEQLTHTLDVNDNLIQISGFITMYRTHCQRVYDSVILGNIEEVKNYMIHFWRGVPLHLFPVMGSPTVINMVGVYDSILYKTIINVFSTTFIECLSNNFIIMMRCLANEILPWLETALLHMPDGLQSMKLNVGCQFSRMLRRQIMLVELCHNTKSILKDTKAVCQMVQDWKNIDLLSVKKDIKCLTFSCYNNLQNTALIESLHLKYQEYYELLEVHPKIESFIQWLESTLKLCVVQLSEKFSIPLLQWARYFIQVWVAYETRVIRDLTLTNSKSFGSFHMISLMSSEYLQHSVELILLDDFINRIMQYVPSQLNTSSGLYHKEGPGTVHQNAQHGSMLQEVHYNKNENENPYMNTVYPEINVPDDGLPVISAAMMTVSHDLFEYGFNLYETPSQLNIYSQHDAHMNINPLQCNQYGGRPMRKAETMTAQDSVSYTGDIDTYAGGSPEYLECTFLQDWNTSPLLHNNNMPLLDTALDRYVCTNMGS